MLGYLLRRIFAAVPVMGVVALFVFLLLRLTPGDPAANLMYAFKVSRNCGQEPNCVQLGIDNCPRVTIGPNTILGLAFRMYLEPETKVGADLSEMLFDRVIKFSPRQ